MKSEDAYLTQDTTYPNIPISEELYWDASASTTSSNSDNSSTSQEVVYSTSGASSAPKSSTKDAQKDRSNNHKKKAAADRKVTEKRDTRSNHKSQAVSNSQQNENERIRGELDALKTQMKEQQEEKEEKEAQVAVQVAQCCEFAEKLDVDLKGINPLTYIESLRLILPFSFPIFLILLILNVSLGLVHALDVGVVFILVSFVTIVCTIVLHNERQKQLVTLGKVTFMNWIETTKTDMRAESSIKSALKLPSQLCRVRIHNILTGEVSLRVICAQLLSQALASGTLMGVPNGLDTKRAVEGCLRRIAAVNQQRQYALRGDMIPQDTAYVATAVMANYCQATKAYPGVGF